MKNKKRNRLAALFAAALLPLLLLGCGKRENPAVPGEAAAVRVGSLKGPTSIGLLALMEESEQGRTENSYEFQMTAGADELLALMAKGGLDIALLPANAAGILYAKTDGNVAVIDINTLGVLYLVSGDTSVRTVPDLRGKTIVLTGKGATPDHVLHYILEENGLAGTDYTLEYKSEAAEAAAFLAMDPQAVGLLPQPFATSACLQNDALSVILDLNEEWTRLQGEDGSLLVTGVTVVRKDYLEENEDAVKRFLDDHRESVDFLTENPGQGAVWTVEAGILPGEEIAEKAIPACNIACITGKEMKQALSGYLEALYDRTPESVGGAMPGDDFYYVP